MRHARFQKLDPVEQAREGLAYRIGNEVMFEIEPPVGPVPLVGIADDPSGNANHRHAGGHILDNHGIRPDPGASTNDDWPQYLGTRANQSVAFDGRMTLAGRPARTSQGDTMIKRDVIADLCSLANHNASAMVNEKPAPDRCSGVDIDIRDEPCKP